MREAGSKQVEEEIGKASQMVGTAWAKAWRPSDEKYSGGWSSYSFSLALPSDQQRRNRLVPLLLRAQMKQMFLSKTDCFNLQHSTLNGSPRTLPNEENS